MRWKPAHTPLYMPLLGLLLTLCLLGGCVQAPVQSESSPTPLPTKETAETAVPQSTLSPTPTESPSPAPSATPEPYAYGYRPYAYAELNRQMAGEETIQVFQALEDAFFAYEDTVYCPTSDSAYTVLTLIQTEFLVFHCDAQLDPDTFYDKDAQAIRILYASKTKQEHDQKIQVFTRIIGSYFKDLEADDPDFIKAILLYRAFSSAMTYDYAVLEETELTKDISPYHALVYFDGICQSFADAYAYLLRQAGIDAIGCGGMTADRTTAHEWTLMRLDGEYFFADPTYENTENVGTGLVYFGMTIDERAEAGAYDKDLMTIGQLNLLYAKDLKIDDTRFAPLRNVSAFRIDRTQRQIVQIDFMGEETCLPYSLFENAAETAKP